MNKYANLHGYTDIEPHEVIKVISDKTVEIRRMDAVRDKSVALDISPGGFCGHVSNQHELKWDITSNVTNVVKKIRLHKDGSWKDKHGNCYILSDMPVKFYDYNF